jgi:hypothetical protein
LKEDYLLCIPAQEPVLCADRYSENSPEAINLMVNCLPTGCSAAIIAIAFDSANLIIDILNIHPKPGHIGYSTTGNTGKSEGNREASIFPSFFPVVPVVPVVLFKDFRT